MEESCEVVMKVDRDIKGPTASAILIVLLAGCSANVERTTFSNGTSGYSIGCSGVQRSLADGEAKARELCPGGYETVSRAVGIPGLGPLRVPAADPYSLQVMASKTAGRRYRGAS